MLTRLISLATQESSGTSGGSPNPDSAVSHGEQKRSALGYDSHIAVGPRSSRLESRTTLVPLAPDRKKRPATTSQTANHIALHILFDREDFLRANDESEDETDLGNEQDTTVDPRLLIQASNLESVSGGARSPMDLTKSVVPSPQKGQFGRSLHITHMENRQPIVDTIRIHPNLNLRTHMSNIPLAGTDWLGNYTSTVHDMSASDLVIPAWAMMTVNTRPDLGTIRDAFQGILLDATNSLENGTPIDVIVERHPNIAALFHEEEFQRSGILSKWAAGMVHSMLLKGVFLSRWHATCDYLLMFQGTTLLHMH